MRFLKKSLMARLVLYFLFLSLIGVGLTGYLVYVQATEALKNSVFERLEAIAAFKTDALNRWIEDQRAEITFLAWLPEVRAQAGILGRHAPSASEYRAAYRILSEYLSFVASRTYNTEELFVLDTRGGIMFSTEKSNEGLSCAELPYFTRGRSMTYVQNAYVSPVSGKLTITIATPLFDRNGRRIGVLASHLNLLHMNRLFKERAGLGRTGETYLVDQHGALITDTRHGGPPASEKGDAPGRMPGGIKTALEGENASGLFRNYAGAPVVGVYRWLNEHDVALAAEMGKNEAFALANRLAGMVILIGAFIALMMGAGVYLLARRITKPVRSVAETAIKVAGGDLSQRAEVVTEDEIGFMARAFNKMTGQLRESIEHLEERVAERTRNLEAEISARRKVEADLQRAKVAAESANQAKSDFLAAMSHEIRTPMNGVIGLSDLALRQEMPPKLRDYFKKIHAAGVTLLGVIDDILDFSKIEAGKISMESVEFNLDDVIENLITVLSVKTEEKGLELLLDIGPEVPRNLVGDPFRLGQVLTNLANNAVKFTESGQVIIRVEHTLDAADPGVVRLKCRVADTGIGMSPEQMGRLFKPFTQADGSITRRFGGTGLGLAICKHLVNLMDGRIDVESAPNQGSAFTFTARFGLGETLERKSYALPDELKEMRVLVVDDNPTAREILCGMLESFSFTAVAAGSGREAIDILEAATQDEAFDLILMDWKMPGMNGLDAAEQIKLHPKLGRIPGILMVTAYSIDENREAARRIGLEGFLTKPVNPSLLFDAILRAFGKEVARNFEADPHAGREIPGLDDIRGAAILLAEDNEINRQVAEELLAAERFFVESAPNGREAVEMIRQRSAGDGAAGSRPYDAVLMDIQMPEMDGYTATAEIRKLGDLPVIAMTAHALAGERERCLAAGMNDYVTKPVNPRELFKALVRWIPPGRRDLPGEADRSGGEGTEGALPTSLAGIDIPAGLERVGGNPDVYRKILIKFFRNNRNAVEEMRAALENCDPETAAKLAHTVKGVAGNIGADDLYRAMEAVEFALKKSDLIKVRPLLDEAETHLRAVLDAIRPLSAAAVEDPPVESGAPGGQIDRNEVGRRLDELAELLEVDVAGARAGLMALKGMVGPAPEIQAIADALEEYDSDAALEGVRSLKERLGI